MSWIDREASDKTIVAPRKKAVPQKPATLPPAAAVPKPEPDRPQRSILLAVIFGFFALLLLGVTASLVTVHVLTGGRSDFTEEELSARLEEPTEISGSSLPETEEDVPDDSIDKYIPPKILELSGDPIIIRRRETVTRQMAKIDPGTVTAVKPIGVHGDVYRLTDALHATEASVIGGLPGSQQDFAFFESATATDETPAATDESEAEPGDQPEASNTSILLANAETAPEMQSRKEVFLRLEHDTTVSQALIESGFDEARAQAVRQAFLEKFDVKALSKGDGLAIRGFAVDPGQGSFIPAQVSAYRGDQYLGTIALTDTDTYTQGADPWFGEQVIEEPVEAAVVTTKQRLLDAIYGTAVRNNVPTSVAGETILLLSRAHDLEQAASEGDKITLLFTTAARDRKTGFGRVLFVRIERAGGDIECFAFQVKAGQQFDCVSIAGEASEGGGMVTPVKGVIAAKYGPRIDPVTKKKKMNFGVDWTAPLGTVVVAAFDGDVIFAGTEKNLGNVVKIAHADKSVTVYAYLQKFSKAMSVGSKVLAGQPIGYVGQSGTAREPLLHFELHRDGRPVDPFGEYQSKVEKGGAVDIFVNRIIYIESGNNCNARNPLSTAVGLGQFIKSTWINTIRQHRPDIMEGRSIAEVLELRTDCKLAREMTHAFTRDNAAVIRSRGHPVTPGHLYLAHFLGVGGALQALGGNPNAMIANVFGEHHVRANPFERGKTIGWLIQWAARKMNQKTPVKLAQNAPAKPKSKYAGNKAFAELKRAVELMLR
jgi:murein DD-endopeptidase MepM/ murein hydrolase activator NlpD